MANDEHTMSEPETTPVVMPPEEETPSPPVAPPPPPPPSVSVGPSLDRLRSEYERIAREVQRTNRGAPEFARLMEEKRVAFGLWHSTKLATTPIA